MQLRKQPQEQAPCQICKWAQLRQPQKKIVGEKRSNSGGCDQVCSQLRNNC